MMGICYHDDRRWGDINIHSASRGRSNILLNNSPFYINFNDNHHVLLPLSNATETALKYFKILKSLHCCIPVIRGRSVYLHLALFSQVAGNLYWYACPNPTPMSTKCWFNHLISLLATKWSACLKVIYKALHYKEIKMALGWSLLCIWVRYMIINAYYAQANAHMFFSVLISDFTKHLIWNINTLKRDQTY